MHTPILTFSRLTLVAFLLAGCGSWARPEPQTNTPSGNHSDLALRTSDFGLPSPRVREAAVAGLFYPGEAKALSKTLEVLLARAPTHPVPRLKALICPHAGYEYSGQTAAIAYKTLAGREVSTVIILAPSHYAWFQGAAIPNVDAWRTPLGTVPISDKAKGLVSVKPFVQEPKCLVERPGWWRQAPKAAPEAGQDTPDTWEHSAEVQVPFLQKVLRNFKILPIIFGEVDPEQVAKALAPLVDDKTMIVASSDLSHYHSYETAKSLDNRCLKAICDLNMDQMKDQEACGKGPIQALMHLAKAKGWKPELLDARNSGDVTGEKDRVVGYSAVAFVSSKLESYGVPERKFLLELARKTLSCVVTNGGEVPAINAADVPPKLTEKRACFVTLTKDKALRGCIGHLLAQEALYQAVADNARNAALRDPRFPPVQGDEVGKIHIEISVLTEPQPLQFSSPDDLVAKLQPHEDGVVLRLGFRSATFLPQVWAQIPDKEQFLNHLAEKAGCEPAAWREKDTTVSIYHVESFEETGEGAERN